MDKANLSNWLVLVLSVGDLGVECELVAETFLFLFYKTVAPDVSALYLEFSDSESPFCERFQ